MRGGCARSGAIAQLGERLLCKQEVVGSIPSGSTSWCADSRYLQLVREMDSASVVVPGKTSYLTGSYVWNGMALARVV
jgi:hypothetical protein